ncbi:MAG: Stp1/IreP family PP2C-type Ser/Thr phosphatase [Nitrospirae bacterium]|nr:Stp1/IreP family PP2C-type Ser/Thr phosphatase [Nitrospirota bacterium]
MKVVISGSTDIGQRRSRNEDSFCIDENVGLLVVADGVGGAASGEVASKMAADVIRDYVRKENDQSKPLHSQYRQEFSHATNLLGSAVKFANMAIYEASNSDPKLNGMATTIVAAILRGDRLSITHAGDSRLYLMRGNNIEQLTDDHSLIAEQIRKGILTKEEAKEVGMRNVITRSLGFTPDVEVDLDEMTVYDGDILLLCSDGLYTMVPESSMLNTAKSSNDPNEVCRRLIDFANKKGGRDNITVVIAYLYKKRLFSFLLDLFKRKWR